MDKMEEKKIEMRNDMEKYKRKASWTVKWYGKYIKKVRWIVKRYGKYGGTVSWIVKR